MIRLRTMRWLDGVLGAAICFGLALLARGRRPQREAGAARPVLFIGLAEMGSVILADHAMRRARDIHGATPHFLIFQHNRDSLALTGTVRPENVFGLRADSLASLAVDTLRFVAWARRRGIATAIDTDPCANFPAILALLSGASRRAGFRHAAERKTGRAALFNCSAPYRPELHLAQNLAALTDAALAPGTAAPPPAAPLPTVTKRRIGPAERQAVLARLRAAAPDFDPARQRILLVNPNVGDLLPQRRWPQEYHAALVERLLEAHAEIFVFLLGTDAGSASLAALEARVGNRRCRAIGGAFALTELPALFACSALLLSSDSGPAHFAAVTALPVVALFGPETPARYAPLGNATTLSAGLPCSPCISPDNRRRTDCRDNRCMRAISVATVMAEIERRLGEAAARPALGPGDGPPQTAQAGNRQDKDGQRDERAVLEMAGTGDRL